MLSLDAGIRAFPYFALGSRLAASAPSDRRTLSRREEPRRPADPDARRSSEAGAPVRSASTSPRPDDASYVTDQSIVVDGGNIIQEPHGIDLYGGT